MAATPGGDDRRGHVARGSRARAASGGGELQPSARATWISGSNWAAAWCCTWCAWCAADVLPRMPDPGVPVRGAPVDMRNSFDGLYALARHGLQQDPLDGQLFAFVNRRATQMRVLYWDRSGWCRAVHLAMPYLAPIADEAACLEPLGPQTRRSISCSRESKSSAGTAACLISSFQLLHRASRDPRRMKRASNSTAAASGAEVGSYLVLRARISVGPAAPRAPRTVAWSLALDRKSTRLNSSHH